MKTFFVIFFVIGAALILYVEFEAKTKSLEKESETLKTVEPSAETTLSPAKMQERLERAWEEVKEKAKEEARAEQLKGALSPAESRRWLQNNRYQVEKKADSSGYIITTPGNRSIHLGNSGRLESGNVALTTDKNGEIRVKIGR